jgi:hypothetical protein
MPSDDKTTRYGSIAILCAFVLPPAGIIYAARCWREAGRHNGSRTLAYAALGFVTFGLVAYSLLFAAVTSKLPLIVH